ncbi:AAA family ATPase [Gracilimonas sediminicola]|uniref:AAA family ATPase n=1 Tax=Gracilimonas sediminicola TaxID=2952158 RepID=A0A9X2L4T2_9BACT|nr:AAA family ATPase [Gracilimonas sediminicola]MCP9292309.1 AAA family ATPase [Gracilimonas sediminicola]
MKSDYSRDTILEQLRNEWLSEVKAKLESGLEAEVQQLQDLLQQTQSGIEADETEKALRKFTEKVQADIEKAETDGKPDNNVEWLENLKPVLSQIQEEVVLPQQESRFESQNDDSGMTKFGKVFKRSARGIQRGVNATSNGVRKVFGGSEKKPPVWKQTIPLQFVVRIHVLRLDKWMREWNNEIQKLKAEVLMEADAWTLHSGGLITYEKKEGEGEKLVPGEPAEITPTQKDLEIFFQEALQKLEQLKSVNTQKLQEHLQSVGDEIERAVSLTGTFERPVSEYTKTKIVHRQNSIQTRRQNDDKVWGELLNVLVQRVLLSMKFMQLHEMMEERTGGFSEAITEFFEDHIESPCKQLMEQLEEAISIFDESEDRPLKQVRQLSSEHQEKMIGFIDQQILEPLGEFTEDAVLGTKFERFTSAIPEWTNEQPEKATLIEKLDLTHLPPVYEFEQVDWQVLVQRVISNHMVKEFMPKEIKAEQFLMKVMQSLQEISQIIYTNLEIADEVKKSDEEEPIQVAREGLERAKTKLEELQEDVREQRESLEGKLQEKQHAAFVKLAMLLEKQDVSEVRLAGAEYKAKQAAVDWKTKLQVWWARISEKGELFGRFVWKKIKQYSEAVRKFLGFAEKEKLEGDKTDLATFLSETDEQIAGLPFIYRRLFDFNKEIDERFYIRKPEQFDRFKKGYELWQNNFPSTFAIVGEKGSGKSLFISLLMEEVLTKHDVIEINFEDTIWTADEIMEQVSDALKLDETESIEDLIAAIKRKKKRVVIILENIQNCYVRNISGFEAMEQLLLLISETNKEIMWIASTTRYGWLFLDKVLNIADYFTHAVETDNLNAQQIEELILKRHRASGYQLKFLPDDATKKSRNFRKLMDDEEKTQEYLQDRYFEKLAKLSEGNSSIAMIFWIRSIREYDDSHFYIDPFDFTAINRIDELDSTELFALAAFVLHDSLMPEHLAKVLNQPLRDSKLLVSRLTSRSILFKTEHGYMLNHLIYRQVVRVLKEANFIH